MSGSLRRNGLSISSLHGLRLSRLFRSPNLDGLSISTVSDSHGCFVLSKPSFLNLLKLEPATWIVFVCMSDDNPFLIPEMDPTLRKQIQECNWQVVNVTTPTNYFHVLRRQIHREFRKPLIVMSPKNLLRHKDCKSNLSEFDDVQGHPGFDKQGTRFKRLIKDQNDHSLLEEPGGHPTVYYELDEERKKVSAKDIAICRVEQLCPFPYDLIQKELKRYPRQGFCQQY
ncbi:2-oxoglutarate dehydrogenase [Nymphaea thermarum]|nr:2-oxoglutarate dehydrogenase [Nymphaea thermarum]